GISTRRNDLFSMVCILRHCRTGLKDNLTLPGRPVQQAQQSPQISPANTTLALHKYDCYV
ncbi:hypothetical protein NDU88_000895, partial [Pleurodeles waltl]